MGRHHQHTIPPPSRAALLPLSTLLWPQVSPYLVVSVKAQATLIKHSVKDIGNVDESQTEPKQKGHSLSFSLLGRHKTSLENGRIFEPTTEVS